MTDRSRREHLLRLVAVLSLVAFGTAGCVQPPSEDSARLDRVVSGFPGWELSEFQVGVFEDGVVSQSEYDEAYSLWRACAEGRGVQVEVVRDDFGLYVQSVSYPQELSADEREAVRTAARECEEGTFPLVDALYRDQVMNPQSLDWNEGVVACLVESGLVDPDLESDDLATGKVELSDAALASPCLENPFDVASGQ